MLKISPASFQWWEWLVPVLLGVNKQRTQLPLASYLPWPHIRHSSPFLSSFFKLLNKYLINHTNTASKICTKYQVPTNPSLSTTSKPLVCRCRYKINLFSFFMFGNCLIDEYRNSLCRYIGETKFAPGEWAGVELDESQGNLYFCCDLYYL